MTAAVGFYNIEAEQSVLGSILLEGSEVLDKLEHNPDDYFLETHRFIAEAIQYLINNNKPIDIVTVSSHLANTHRLEKVGGVTYLSELTSSIPTTANVEYYEQIVKQQAKKRFIKKTLLEAQESLFEIETDDEIETLSQSTAELLMSYENHESAGFTHAKEVMMDVIDHASKERGSVIGVPSGYTELDRMLSGFKPNELIIIGARPSMGKTAFMLNIANNAAKKGALTPIYSLEMSNLSLGQRILSSEVKVDSRSLKIGTNAIKDKDWLPITQGAAHISDRDILFNDKSGITVHQIRKDLTRLRKANPDKEIVCFIDYLQLIKGDSKYRGNRTQEISEISRVLKVTALELNLAIVALSQLSRGVEQRQDKRPMMSDLRESGSIEQDADVIAFLYRDDYYDKESEIKNIVECIIAKQRDGAIGTVSLMFEKEYGRFANLERRFE